MRSNICLCVCQNVSACVRAGGEGGGVFGADGRVEGSNERFSSSGRIVAQITNVSIL